MNDELISAYKQHVDRSILRENLRLTPQQRSEKFERAMALVFELQRVARQRRQSKAEASIPSLTLPTESAGRQS